MKDCYNPKNLDGYKKNKKYVIVSTEWNDDYVSKLTNDCINTLREKWIKNIKEIKVPWCLELTYWSIIAFKKYKADIVIVIWVVIKWDTDHYKYVCSWVTEWITHLQIKLWKPIVFWVLTCDNDLQVIKRLWKWKEWALSAIQITKIID